MVEREVVIVNRTGLHTRPAATLVKTAAKFKSDLFIFKDGMEINGKSIIGVMTLAAEQGAPSVMAHLKERANLRNQILYAGDSGYPIPVDERVLHGLELARRNTFLLLKVFLLVDAYPSIQSFARQCLLAFLKMLGQPGIEVTFE